MPYKWGANIKTTESLILSNALSVILRILGFQIAPHLGSEITSSLATSIAPPKSQGSQEIYTALRKEITQFVFFS